MYIKVDILVFVCVIFYTFRAYRFSLSRVLWWHRFLVYFIIELLQKITEQCYVICVILGVHIAYNNLNVYTYRKLHKDKSPWYCICSFRKELPHGSTDDTQLKKLLHGEVVVSPEPKVISSIIKPSKYLD